MPTVVTLLVAVVLVLATVGVFISFPRTTIGVKTWAAIVAMLVHFVGLSQLYKALTERLPQAYKSGNPIARTATFALFAVVGFCCEFLCIPSALNAGRLASWTSSNIVGLTPLSFAAYHVAAPLLAPTVFVLLASKVRTARMLDAQKRHLGAMARAINGLQFPEQPLLQAELNSGTVTAEEASKYERTLAKVCYAALKAVVVAGQYAETDVAGATGILFLADPVAKVFVPVTIVGAEPAYRDKLESFRPPFWAVQSFKNLYNLSVEQAKTRSRKSKDLLVEFRESTKAMVSTTGVVYEVERELGIDATQHSYSLTFRDELFADLELDDRPVFEQIVGIPILLYGRKLGVFLLLGNREHTFYLRDRIYSVVGDLIGSAIKSGIVLGYFRREGLPGVFTASPKVREDAELAPAISILNTMRGDFSQSCK